MRLRPATCEPSPLLFELIGFMRRDCRIGFAKLRPGWAKLHTVLVLWLVVVVTAFGALAAYSRTPGPARAHAATGRVNSGLVRPRESTLLMFLHPRCPCSRASLEQFNRILAKSQATPHASIIFVRPKGMPEGWERSDLWDAANKIPGVEVHVDVDGVEARRFGATTSGAVVLIDPSGKVSFQGGITNERAHAGDNPGADAVLTALRTGRSPTTNTGVFGCALFD